MAKSKKRKIKSFYVYGDKWFTPDKRYKREDSYIKKFYEMNKSKLDNSDLGKTNAGALDSLKFRIQQYKEEGLDFKTALKRVIRSGDVYDNETRERYFIQEKFKENKDIRDDLLKKLDLKKLRYKKFQEVEDYERTDTKEYYKVFRYGDSDFGFAITKTNDTTEAYEYTVIGGLK